jgi:hypothetical protein
MITFGWRLRRTLACRSGMALALLVATLHAHLGLATARAEPLTVSQASDLPAPAWTPVPRLADVRYDGARDLGPAVREAPVLLPLPWAFLHEGIRYEALRVGAGWVQLARASVPVTAVSGSLDAAGVAPDGPRIDVLSGPDVGLAAAGSVLALLAEDGLAIRWTALNVAGAGLATVEILVDRRGALTAQYLRVPHGAPRTPVSTPGTGWPATATALRHQPTNAIDLTRLAGRLPHPAPMASGPPPMGCDVPAGTWCDEADGPGSTILHLSEGFDDGASAARGWAGDGLWHEVAFATCSPGSSANPGMSWYHGENATCRYLDDGRSSLFAPPVGPIAAGARMTFLTRCKKQEVDAVVSVDLAEVYVNGTLLGNLNTFNLNRNLWYNINPINLDAWAGQTITVEFRFTSDATVTDLGWFVDDVVIWEPNGADAECVTHAGTQGREACSEQLSTQWDFYEGAFCQGCTYTFYALVECGREMHVPLSDMEGADIEIVNMVTGLPVPLRCVNQTARADAGMGGYSAFNIGDAAGNPQDCCGLGRADAWWGPPFDQTDNAGPGHVAWGFPTCSSFLAYDANGDTVVDCTELPPTCGGQLDLVSPGEVQTMDCFISQDTGLCGLYRVRITSGGFGWSLFANCNGANTPQFQLFHDCTAAWTAYNPLPELAVANLVTSNGCPALDVSFDLVNIGCADHPGPTLVRISDNCTPSDVLDHVVTDPIPVGGSVPVTVAFTASCSPVRVEVRADPDASIPECTESITVAACRAEEGVNALAAFTCGCTAQLAAEAGADQAACTTTLVTLDGSASTIAPCATRALYRWLDGTGAEVRGWGPDPTFDVRPNNCPGGQDYTLEVQCEGEPCTQGDVVRVSCLVPVAAAGPDVRACVGTPVVLDGSGSSVTNCAQPQFRWFHGATEVRGWSPDPNLDLGALTCTAAGTYRIEARCATGGACQASDTMRVDCVEVVANAGPDLSVCEATPFSITGAGSTSRGCTQVLYQWFDVLGNPVSPVSTSPRLDVPGLTGCPGVLTLVLVAACGDVGFETCGSADAMDVACPKPVAPPPTSTSTCGQGAQLLCGVAEPGVTYGWDTDTAVDSDGDADPTNDQDAAGCDVTVTWPSAGAVTVRAWAVEPTGCTSFADLVVDVLADPLPPVPAATSGCPGTPTSLTCGAAEPGVTYTWDLDLTVDTDGDTIADDDGDATGCDVMSTHPEGSTPARVTATDARGCRASADVVVDVNSGTPPGEPGDVRFARAGAALQITWQAASDAQSYFVVRGTLATFAGCLPADPCYDHAADDTAGQGACSVGAALTFTDPDDASTGNWYYLVGAVNACGVEGSLGDAWDGRTAIPRDARVPMPSCP